jgi:hypothetical protein
MGECSTPCMIKTCFVDLGKNKYRYIVAVTKDLNSSSLPNYAFTVAVISRPSWLVSFLPHFCIIFI